MVNKVRKHMVVKGLNKYKLNMNPKAFDCQTFVYILIKIITIVCVCEKERERG